MRSRWISVLLLGTSGPAFLMAVPSCSSSSEVGGDPLDAELDAAPDVMIDVDVPGDAPAEADAIDECAATCSLDLHDLLDCHGNLLKTCPPNQACAPGGECIEPCKAAMDHGSGFGCDFYAQPPSVDPSGVGGAGSCFAVAVANTWTTEVSLQAFYNGSPLDISQIARIPTGAGKSITYDTLPGGKLPAGKIAVLFLAHDAQANSAHLCPTGITPGVTEGPFQLSKTGMGGTFRVSADRPVVAVDYYPYGGGQVTANGSANLLIPTSAWGTNYLVAGPGPAASSSQPFIQLVARDDKTIVTIKPKVAIVGDPDAGIPSAPENTPTSYSLSAGQMLQLSQYAELAGSIVESNRPIGLWGGDSLNNVPVAQPYADPSHQQVPALRSLGSTYIAAPHGKRVDVNGGLTVEERPVYRLIGVVDGTTLTYEPSQPKGAPSILRRGEIATFRTGSAFVVRSQQPFYLSIHMVGSGTRASEEYYNDRGDPEWNHVVPPEQFLKSYLFLTDPTYDSTQLVLTRRKENGGFEDVSVDCVGTVTGWTPIDGADNYEYAIVDLVKLGAVAQGKCDNGVHTATSAAPFGLTVWGWATHNSYGFPAGMAQRRLNEVVAPAK